MKIPYSYRLNFLITILLVSFGLIWLQMFNLQVLKSSHLIVKLAKQFSRHEIFLRGDIRDRNGNVLVLNNVTYDLYSNVKSIRRVSDEDINILAKIINANSIEVKEKLRKTRINNKLYSGLSETQKTQIKKHNFNFVYPISIVKRIYPHKKMAAHVIGFVNGDGKGQHGVEYSQENILMKLNESDNSLYLKGYDIVLTINSALQEFAEKELRKAVHESHASKGAVIVLSPKTGEVYAWAVQPTYDPNLFFKESAIKNWSITDIYEPGSTFKILTVASALENMTIGRADTFFDPGYLKVGKRIIKNHHKTKPQNISLLELFKQSSNVASAQIGLKMGREIFYDSIKKFMIGSVTGVDLPGESKGLLLNSSKWKEIDLATTAFGQGAVSVTPIQLVSAIASIANHGIWVQPHVLKGLWDEKYNIINESPYQYTTEQVISPDVADYVSSLLKQSVKENLEAMAYIAGNVPGYNVAGKTGTAQKLSPDGKGYWAGHTVASFIGYFPASDPELLILAVVDDPQTGGGWGNTICGPIFNEVAKTAGEIFLKDKK